MADKYKILFVDDEENILHTLCRLFRTQKDYEIFTASGGQAALDILSKNKVDMVISDQRMPGMEGTELLRRVKELYPDTVRILLSGYSDFNALVTGINEGEIYRFFTKPWKSDELLDHVRNILKQRDMMGVVRHIADKLSKLIEDKDAIKIDTIYGENNISIKMEAENRVLPREEARNILNLLMSYVIKRPELQAKDIGIACAGGIIEKQKGRVVFTLNMEGGTSLVIELPVNPEETAP
jgi:YesN/AraC family two-component response regulator